MFSLNRDGGDDARVLIDSIRRQSTLLRGSTDLDPLLEQIGDARFVLIGEASHGTSEFYAWRARISQRLIEEKGFNFVSVEGDWPDCYRVNRYVKGYPDSGSSAREVLHAFERWPTWMWANAEVAAFAEWLRAFNHGRAQKTGFFGLDVYSLWESMNSIVSYLEENDPEAVELARKAFLCFEPYYGDEQAYAWSTRMVPESCEDEVIELLQEVRNKVPTYSGDQEETFSAEQNALVMVDAERYYRAMVRSNANSWNVRDTHMMDTLTRLARFYGPDSKAIVWAHNTHVGDARATDMARAGMVNIGQLARQQFEEDGVFLTGFGSYRGSVIAGEYWDAEMQRMPVPAAEEGSWEDLFHQAVGEDRLLAVRDFRAAPSWGEMRGHRAIGVVYNPEHERFGNYVPTRLPERYDGFLFVDESHALHPLHMRAEELEEVPETYPWGL